MRTRTYVCARTRECVHAGSHDSGFLFRVARLQPLEVHRGNSVCFELAEGGATTGALLLDQLACLLLPHRLLIVRQHCVNYRNPDRSLSLEMW